MHYSLRWELCQASANMCGSATKTVPPELSHCTACCVAGCLPQAAMKQLEAVVPQYRAAAAALQGQVTVLKEKLGAASRERGQLQDEVGG